MALLERNNILNCPDREEKVIHVPEWKDENGNDEVRIKSLSVGHRERFEKMFADMDKPQNNHIRVRIVIASVVDEEGNQLFKNEDVNALAKKSSKAIERIFNEAMKLSGMYDNAVEDVAKN